MRRKAVPREVGDEPPPVAPSLFHSGGIPAVPVSPPEPQDPYRNLGFRIGRYARRVFASDLEVLHARIQGKGDREELALAEGITIGSGCTPHLHQDGDGEVCEVRCIFTAGAKRIIITPSPLQIPPEALHDRRISEDFAGWLLAREDEDLFDVKFG